MRENTDPGAKMLQLLIDGVFLTRRQLRTSTNGMAYNHQFQTQGKNWLRLTRAGSTFTAQHSTDGSNWSTVLVTSISMPNCIPIGLVTMNNQASGVLTATFGNVEIKTNAALYSPASIDLAENEEGFSIYPNPTSGEIWVDFPRSVTKKIQLSVHNSFGQRIKQIVIKDSETSSQKIELFNCPTGLYWLEIKMGEKRKMQKVIIK